MKFLNYGSLNIDNVYQMEHFVAPGETASSMKLTINAGGKGLNQSIALAHAGCEVFHAGAVGFDGDILRNALCEAQVATNYVATSTDKSGHAIIEVDQSGENRIILYGGANQKIKTEDVDKTFSNFSSGDVLVLQNEINNNRYIMHCAKEIGMKIVLNPSPFNDKIKKLPLELVDIFMINEVEGEQLTGCKLPDDILKAMHEKFPTAQIVLTLGKKGAAALFSNQKYVQPIFETTVVDTTAAGDTFTGYFLKEIFENHDPQQALKIASMASAIAVSIEGAAKSIPTYEKVIKFQKEHA